MGQVDTIFLYYSKDDPVVPSAQTEKLAELLPSAKLFTFSDRGHFSQSDFPELLANIV
ncbi:MAG: alpha/beta hydrolase [Candidatus Peribacteria bacterium]|jgi:pimeloyl-ACP methyl ester carboxylesterase|nr:alpha/beta hydrolase [Candidatus Peribacteria bacterium]